MVGVPEELGGAVEERSAVTSVLMSEALAQGDMGIAVACLAPAGVSTALSLWGDADQQATYLPEFVGEDVPAAALALLEPRALFDPFELQTTRARAERRLRARRRQVARPPGRRRRAVRRRRRARGPRPGAVHRRVEDRRASASSPSPAMGIRAAGTGRLIFEDVKLPAGALLGDGDPRRLPRVRAARPARPGARWPSAPARPCSTT